MRHPSHRLQLSVLVLLLAFVSALPAAADCPDIPYTCRFGAIFLRGTCWEFPKTCVPCGNADCPGLPSYSSVPNRIDAGRCPKATQRMDGCSAPVNDPASEGYKDLFKGACDQHDFCYSTLASGKGTCDDNFRKNMESICRNYYRGALNSVQLGSCLAATGVWFSAVALGAQSSYDGDQNWAVNNCQAPQPVQPASQKVRLRGKSSGRLACVVGAERENGVPLHLFDLYNGFPDQEWVISDAGSGYSYLKVQHTQKCLDLSNGTHDDGGRLQQWDCVSDTDNQKWKVERQDDGTVVLRSKASGKCVAAPSGTVNGTPVVQEPCTGSADQRWIVDTV